MTHDTLCQNESLTLREKGDLKVEPPPSQIIRMQIAEKLTPAKYTSHYMEN